MVSYIYIYSSSRPAGIRTIKPHQRSCLFVYVTKNAFDYQAVSYMPSCPYSAILPSPLYRCRPLSRVEVPTQGIIPHPKGSSTSSTVQYDLKFGSFQSHLIGHSESHFATCSRALRTFQNYARGPCFYFPY